MEVFQWIKDAQAGDKNARDTFIEKNTGLVWSVVKRFTNRGYEAEDLFQIGCIGLIKAVDRFDTTFSVEFSTYAVPLIAGELKRFFRDNGMIHISRSIKENGWKIRQAEESFYEKYGKSPSVLQIEESTGLTREEIVLALEANMEVESIDQSISFTDGSTTCMLDQVTGCPGEMGSFGEKNGRDKEKEQVLDKLLVSTLLKKLSQREKLLITLRFFCDKTQTEVAKQFGISQVQVSRLEKKILKKMREEIQGK